MFSKNVEIRLSSCKTSVFYHFFGLGVFWCCCVGFAIQRNKCANLMKWNSNEKNNQKSGVAFTTPGLC